MKSIYCNTCPQEKHSSWDGERNMLSLWGYQPARQTLEAVANQPVQNRQSHASLSVKIRET